MSRLSCFHILAILTIIFTIIKILYGRPNHPAPFLHNPNIPPSTYHGDNQKYLTIPGYDYYPPQPPPPPGFSSYGTHSYKDKSGIIDSEVKAGIALWELIKNEHHHQYYGIQASQNTSTPNYHDMIRERYTTKIVPNKLDMQKLESYNVLEMTNYLTFDSRGILVSTEGDKTCFSIYNAKSLTEWHWKHFQDFKKKFPNSIFPLFRIENYTKSESFTVHPGRIIHREPISVTCCGTSENKINLNLLTNGRHPTVNCVNHAGFIPIRKLVFFKNEEEKPIDIDFKKWVPIELEEPDFNKQNVTT